MHLELLLLYQKRKLIRPGIPRINVSHFLAKDLIGAWLPGVTLGTNLTGLGCNLTPDTAVAFGQTVEGAALAGTAAHTGMTATAPAIFKPTSGAGVSFYVRLTGKGGYINGGASYIGLLYDNANTSPWAVYTLYQTNPGSPQIQPAWNVAGAYTQGLAYNIANAGIAAGVGVSFTVNGNVVTFVNGVQVGSDAWGSGAPTTSATSQISINQYPSLNNNTTNSLINLALMFNRPLTAVEHAALDSNPYAVFIWSDDDLFTELNKQVYAALSGLAVSQVKATGTERGITSLTGKARAALEAQATERGVTSLLGRATADTAAKPAMAPTTSLVGRATAEAMAKASAAGAAALAGRAASQVKVTGTESGTTSLAGRVATAAKARALSAGTTALAATGHVFGAARTAFTGVVSLAGRTAANAWARLEPPGAVALMGAAAAMFRGRGASGGVVSLSSRASTSAVARVAVAGATALAVRIVATAAARATVAGVTALAARTVTSVNARIASAFTTALSGRIRTASAQHSTVIAKVALQGRIAIVTQSANALSGSGLVHLVARAALAVWGRLVQSSGNRIVSISVVISSPAATVVID